MLTQLELQSLVSMGVNVVIDAQKMSSLDMRQLLLLAKTGNSVVEIKNASVLSAMDARLLATTASKNVKFNFVD